MFEKPKLKGRILSFYKSVHHLSGLTYGQIYALLLRFYDPGVLELSKLNSKLKEVVVELINDGYLRKETPYLDADTVLFATPKAYLLIDKKAVDETIVLPKEC